MIIGGSGSGKANTLLNLIREQQHSGSIIDKIYLYAKDLTKPKYEFLVKKRENAERNFLIVQMHLLSVQIRCVMFMRILMITIQAEKEKI